MTATVVEPRPTGQYTHKQIMVVLSGLMLGMFLAALDQTVVSTSIYKIGQSLDGLTAQAWVTTAFLITSTVATPLYGKLSDMYGRKPFFLAAIAIFVVGSAACSFATSMYMLAGFRAFQGVGAGGLFTLALAITGDIIPPRQRAKYQGYFLAVFGTSSVLGPVVGGAFAGQDHLAGLDGWRWIFLLNVPIGIVALFVINRVLRVDHSRTKHGLDLLGTSLLIVGVVPLLLVAEQGREWGWGSVSALACYVIGLAGLAAFVVAERRAGESALLPTRLFRVRAFTIGSLQSTFIGIGMFGGLTLIPLYLQLVKGKSPTEAGLLTLPLVLGLMAGSITSGQVTSRTGHYRIFPIVGCASMLVGLTLLSRISADSSLGFISVCMVLVGVGIGMNTQSIVLSMQNSVRPREIGVATSSATFFRQMGGTIGVAVFLSVVYSTVQGKINSAYARVAADPAFQAAAAAHPDQIAKLRGGGTSTLNDTSFLATFDPALSHPFKAGFTSAMTIAFLAAAGVLVIALVLAILQREVPLRTMSGEQAAAEEAAAAQLAREQAAVRQVVVLPTAESLPVPGEQPVGSGGRVAAR